MAQSTFERLAVAAVATLVLTACSRSDEKKPAQAAVVELPQAPASSHQIDGDKSVRYVISNALAIIGRWHPVPLSGPLQRYGDSFDPASEALFKAACRDIPIWRETRKFEQPMGEVPTAVVTPRGTVLYQSVWEKYTDAERRTYLGVRIEDHQCGAVDRREGSAAIDGDEDIVAVLIAAMAVREMDPEADRHELTSLQMDTVRKLVTRTFEPAAHTPSTSDRENRTYSSAEFQKLLFGKTKREVIALLGKPISLWSGAGDGTQTYDYSPDQPYLGNVNFRVADDATGMTLRSVQVHFGPSGRVSDVGL